MRLTAILVLTACLQLAAVVCHAQKQTISLSFKEAPLQAVMTEIRTQTGLDFLYDVEWLKLAKPVTIEMKDASVDAVLDSCFSNQPFTYARSGSIITIISRSLLQKPMAPPKNIMDVTGKVINMNGSPLEGATVTVKGTTTGTTTNAAGDFILKEVSKQEMLEITYVGYLPQEVKVNKINNAAIRMEVNPLSLDAVVTTGYTMNTKRYTLGTSTKINSTEISNQPVNNPLAVMQGKVPGMVVTQRGGLPGSGFNVQIRGQRSIGTTPGVLPPNSPLFVIDGVPFLTSAETLTQRSQIVANSPFSTINPADIESIEILKDANATSIYGSLGANGVVLITTKRARVGKTTVDIKMYTGWGKVARSLEYMNTEQYIQMRKEALANDGETPTTLNAPDLMLWNTNRYIDWKNKLIGGSSHLSNAHIRLSGGTATTQFTASIGLNKETTVFPGDFSKTLISSSMQVSHTSENKRLEAIVTASYGSDKSKLMSQDPTFTIDLVSPNSPAPLDSLGKLVFRENSVSFLNPYSYFYQPYDFLMERLTSSVKINYKLFSWLHVRTNLGYSIITGDEYKALPMASQDPLLNPTGEAAFGQSKSRNWIVEPQLEFTQSLFGEKNKLKAIAGTSFREQISKYYLNLGTGYTNDAVLGTLNGAAVVAPSNESKLYRIQSLYGLINYTWDYKYLIEFTGRRDGSSRFGPKKQFGYFGSVAAGWIFSNEKFIQNSLRFISYGKLRVSYGSTGNDQIGDYEFFDTWVRTQYPYQVPSYRPNRLYNNEYKWERHNSIDVSLDLRFLNDKILLSAVWNQTTTNNQLTSYQLPSQTGFTSVLKNFPGSVGNRNMEIELSTNNISRNNFKWTTSLNLAIHKNQLLYFPGLSSSSYHTDYMINKPLSLRWAYRTTGVNPVTGVYRILDINKNVINFPNSAPTTVDLVPVGSHAPNYYGGLQNSFHYNNWKLDFMFQFAKQKGLNNVISQALYAGFASFNMPVTLLNRWQKPGDASPYQRYTQDAGSDAFMAAYYYSSSEAIVTDASFIRLKNLSLSYSLPYDWMKKMKMNSCNVFIQGQNLLTITSYKGGHDPESGTVNPLGLPPLKLFVFGIQASF